MSKPNLTRKYDPKCLLVAKKAREIEATIKQLRYTFNAYYYGGLKLWWGLRKLEVKANHYESGAYQDYQICKGKYEASGEWIPATYDEERRFTEVWKPEWEDFIKMYWESFGNGIISMPEVEIELQTETLVSGKSEIDLLLERTRKILEFFAEQFGDLLVSKRSRKSALEQVKEALRAWNKKEKEDVAEAIEEMVSVEHAETLLSKQYKPEADGTDTEDERQQDDSIVVKPLSSNGIEVVQLVRKQTEQMAQAQTTPPEAKVTAHPCLTGTSNKKSRKSRKQQQEEAKAFLEKNGFEQDGEIEGVQIVASLPKKTATMSELNSSDLIPF